MRDLGGLLRRIPHMKTLLALILATLAAAPAALADGVPQYAAQGGSGITGPNGLRYVALGASDQTLLTYSTPDGALWSGPAVPGSYGIPMVTYRDAAGLSRDGRTLFLQSTAYGSPTRFLVLDTRPLSIRDRFTLNGNFSFDALSPDGSRLYLIQRVDATNYSRYVVRAYDVRRHTLLPGLVADRTQKDWVMEGQAMTRATTPGGRWVYTLYSNPNGYPFIHALDTVRGVAHCIGIPWTSSDQGALWNVVLSPTRHGIDVHWRSGKRWLAVDTTTWRVSPDGGSGFPWPWLGFLAVPPLLVLLRRRRAHGTLLPREA